ncbi:HAD family hydrolase [Piscinibacter sp.]|uniref:HAD family hydrolase n=1 Tax=Piscinibacter sp. TaxID=1903157 RepID=UPI00355A14C8
MPLPRHLELMPLPRFRAAIFDMDGLLIDSERPIRDAWLQVARELGAPLEECDYLQVVGRGEADSRRLLQERLGPRVSYDTVRERVGVMLAQRQLAQGFAVKAGVIGLLQQLRERGVPCGVASSTERAEVERRLQHARLMRLFDHWSGGDEVTRGKPHPDLFLLAAQRMQQAPQDCLVFEDSEHGARGALAAGMSVVIVPDLKTPSDDARAACLAVLASLCDAQAHIADWFGPA